MARHFRLNHRNKNLTNEGDQTEKGENI